MGLRRLDPDVSEAGDMTNMTSMTLDKDPRAVGGVGHCKQIKSPDDEKCHGLLPAGQSFPSPCVSVGIFLSYPIKPHMASSVGGTLVQDNLSIR